MPSYLLPGVYIEEIPSGAKPIEGVSTSVAALIGYTTEGPIGEATLVHSWDEFKAGFGAIHSAPDHLGLAAFNFLLNGGRDAYVARLAQNATAATLPAAKLVGRATGAASAVNVLAVAARSAGRWGDRLQVRVTASDGFRFALGVSLVEPGAATVVESFAGLSMDSSDAAYVLTVVNGNSRYLRVDLSNELKATPAAYYKNATSVSGDLAALIWSNVLAGRNLTLNVDNLGAGLCSGNGGVSEMEVSNGAVNFTGQQVSEVFVGGGDNPTVGGCNNAGGQGGQGGSTFTIGDAVSFSQFGININLPVKANTFYDMHIKAFGVNMLPAGANRNYSSCLQQYTMGGTTLNGGQVFNRLHNITRTNVGGQDCANIDLAKS